MLKTFSAQQFSVSYIFTQARCQKTGQSAHSDQPQLSAAMPNNIAGEPAKSKSDTPTKF